GHFAAQFHCTGAYMACTEAGYTFQVVRAARVAEACGNIGEKLVGDGTCRRVVAQTNEAYLCLRVNLWNNVRIVGPLSLRCLRHKKEPPCRGIHIVVNKYNIIRTALLAPEK